MKAAAGAAPVGTGEGSHHLSLDVAPSSGSGSGISDQAADRRLQAAPSQQGPSYPGQPPTGRWAEAARSPDCLSRPGDRQLSEEPTPRCLTSPQGAWWRLYLHPLIPPAKCRKTEFSPCPVLEEPGLSESLLHLPQWLAGAFQSLRKPPSSQRNKQLGLALEQGAGLDDLQSHFQLILRFCKGLLLDLSAVATGSGTCPPEGPASDRPLKRPVPANHSLPGMASGLDSSCVAARIRPICRYKKRRLVRINSITHLNRKPPKLLSLRCSCEQPNSCVLCEFKASLQTLHPESLSLEERIALLDSGFHPILSFPHSNPLHLHLEALLREDHWPSPKPQPRKPPQCRLKDLTNSVCSPSLAAPAALLKGLARYSLCTPLHPPRSKPGTSHPPSSFCLENPPGPAASNVPGHPTMAGSSALPAKKKKAETSYDINNIVIPMSMAAATRVEKLQYKEILTPSWRTVDPKELVILEEADTELEDTSDETYLNYHQKFEELERARWDSWTGTSSHRRGNRSSHKADGRWVPPPGCQESGPNSLHYPQGANSPTASLSPDPSGILTPLLLRGRGGNSFSEDSSVSTDEVQNVTPWDPRTFPLSDADYRALQGPPHKTFGQPRDEALRTNPLNATGFPHPREALLAKRQAPPEHIDQQRPAEPFILPTLNNR